MRKLAQLLVGALAVLVAANASAAPVVFTNRTAWTGQVTGVANVDFEGIAPVNSLVFQGTSVLIGGVAFTSSLTMYAIGPNYAESGGLFCLGSGACLFGYNTGITATFGSPVTAFGVDLRGYLEGSTTFSITLSTGDVYSRTVTNPAGGFFGITSNIAISSVYFDPTTNYMVMDNLSFASAASGVPTPGALALIGLGLLGIGTMRRMN